MNPGSGAACGRRGPGLVPGIVQPGEDRHAGASSGSATRRVQGAFGRVACPSSASKNGGGRGGDAARRRKLCGCAASPTVSAWDSCSSPPLRSRSESTRPSGSSISGVGRPRARRELPERARGREHDGGGGAAGGPPPPGAERRRAGANGFCSAASRVPAVVRRGRAGHRPPGRTGPAGQHRPCVRRVHGFGRLPPRPRRGRIRGRASARTGWIRRPPASEP